MQERLLKCLSEAVGKSVDVHARFDSLGVDSLDFLFAMGAVETEFGVTIPEPEMVNMETAADVLLWLEARC